MFQIIKKKFYLEKNVGCQPCKQRNNNKIDELGKHREINIYNKGREFKTITSIFMKDIAL